MKLLLVTLLAMMMLAACGNDSNTVDGNENTSSEGNTSNNQVEDVDNQTGESDVTDSLSAEEVLEKSTEAMTGLSSYSMEMTTEQEISMAGEDSINMSSTVKSDISQNPLAMYQVTSVQDADGMMGSMDTETYFTSDGFFVFEPLEQKWVKLPQEFADEMNALSDMQSNPAVQLEMLKAYSDNMTLSEEGNSYVLTFEGSGEQFNEMIGMVSGMMGEDMSGMMEEMLSMMTVNELNYVIHVDKETFFQTKMTVYMDMEMDMEGDTIASIQEVDATLYNFDEVGEITIPQEVLDNAEELSLEDLQELDEQGGV
ncbi:DUF6612 family protein [Sutcliffiella rhizosphaerae]|uniref:DUF6612 family protein n=1 Tax=Sutcliffiella rhizosphaerae TaxID=2880967 RepID=UPI00295EDB8C|nr:DUF6612 family protein [Sutcliffiella rhizosphaerae]